MKVKLALNIGLDDQRRLGLPHVAEGSVLDVDKKTGDHLLAKGWAYRAAAAEPVTPVVPDPGDEEDEDGEAAPAAKGAGKGAVAPTKGAVVPAAPQK